MATLTGQTIAGTYKDLLKIDATSYQAGVVSALRKVQDGDATDSSLSIGTVSIAVDATDKIFLDGGGTTYLQESSDGVLVINAATEVQIDTGIYDLNASGEVQTVTDANWAVSAGTNVDIDAEGAMQINSLSTISIGNDPRAQAINIGNGSSARTITIGHAASTAVNLNALAMTFTTVNAFALTDGTCTLSLGGTGAFGVTGTSIDIDASAALQINSSSGTINIGNDPHSNAMNIGTDGTRTITMGNTNSSTQVVLNSGTGGIALNTTGAGDIALTSADTFTITSGGSSGLTLRVTSGPINIGDDDVDQHINIGTDGERTISIGTGDEQNTVLIGNTNGDSGIQMFAGTDDIRMYGKVGINTPDPSYALEVAAAAGGEIALARGTSAAEDVIETGDILGQFLFLGYDAGYSAASLGAAIVATAAADFIADDAHQAPTELKFFTQDNSNDDTIGINNPRMMIDQDGNVGIGLVDPEYLFHVSDALNPLTTGYLTVFYSNSSDTSARTLVGIDNNHASADDCVCLSINQDGDDYMINAVGAGTFNVTTNGQVQSLYAYNNAAGSTQTALYADNSGFFGKITSIREHKKNIVDMEDISWLYDVRPVNFEYKVMETCQVNDDIRRTGKYLDESDGNKQYGMIAEELLEVAGAKDLLEYDSYGKLSGISYHRFIPILIKAVQELSAKVTALENA